MTNEEFREVDTDLLADYLGGALDGTPQQAEIARLVDADPAWAEAYALLAPAVTQVRAELARWAEPSPELPPAVAERIAAALATADAPPADAPADVPVTLTGATGSPEPAAPATPVGVPAQGGRRPGSSAPSESGRGRATGPGRRQRRWARTAAPVAVAAVAVVAVGLGLGLRQLSTNTTDSGAMDRPASAPGDVAAAGAARTSGPALHSGTDYSPQTLGQALGSASSSRPSPLLGTTSSAPQQQPGVDAEGGRRPAPDGSDQLARLSSEAALTACLAAVAAEHGSTPLIVEVIDYAQFQGEQALVIRFTDPTGAHWAWVSGPECGVPGSGSDSRYSARVG
ncbi:hypothetical protein OOJ91_21200 [Micromonospora lupini]|uniref:hypothetical protein n=1 Tax=Micromonospora lupini TaxID=285679 RepID=UPI002258D706|nr:hypothetical protein [Micromonospora lupini]MCX5068362.1 hypothetical protein [Micromonospora lupini]